jgi:AraC-like DNA-binding protein/mannose-6-phosphate isomerase-like protein (cupin superfamily)
MLPRPGSKRLFPQNADDLPSAADVFGCELVQFDKEKINIFAARMHGCGPHWHDAPEFILILDGGFTVIVNSVPVDLRSGGMIYINGDDIHSLEPLADGGILLTIQFSPELFGQTDRVMRIGYHVAGIDEYSGKDAGITRMVASLLGDSVDSPRCDPCRRMASIYGLLSELRGAGTLSAAPDKGLPRRDDELLVKDCMEHINRHYDKELSLGGLAQRACLSYHHFSRLFKKYSGYNFKDYLNHVRVSKARFLLKNTRTPITGICHACGFSEHKHFIAVFRKYHGMPPTEFRKKCLLEASARRNDSLGSGYKQLSLTNALLEKIASQADSISSPSAFF